MNHFAELRQLLQLLWRRWWLLALAGMMAGFIGYYISTLQAPRYEATASLIVGRLLHPGVIERADVQLSQQLTVAYADLARRRPVLQAVVDELGLESWQALRNQVRTVPLESSQLLEIRAQSTSASEAALIANAMARQLIALQTMTSGTIEAASAEAGASTLAIFDEASVPTQPVSPDIPLNTALAIAVGLLIATGLVLWAELSDDRVRSVEEVLRLTNVPLLQTVRPVKGRGLLAQLVTNQEP
ncbi:MAG: hypothetical protein KDE19_21185, partial [Caldilineaceae bacterium]|nr:hypothetical protein [Caldilineaceae bacterium]